MVDYGKLNISTAFNPTSAFPLDARCYFESLADAQAAAATAGEVGSTSSVYYYGQTVSVVESGVATLYIITPDNELKKVQGDPQIIFGTHYEFPSVGQENKLYIAKDERNSYIWVDTHYELVSVDHSKIDGGDASSF